MKRSEYTEQIRATIAAFEELERLYGDSDLDESRARAWIGLQRAIERLDQSIDGLVELSESLRRQGVELADARIWAELERQRYQSLFEGLPDGYLVTDAEGIIHEANPAASAMLGVQAGFLRHRPLVDFIVADDRPDVRRILGSIRHRDPLDVFEWDMIPYHGNVLKAAITLSPERDSDGGVIAIRWLLRDVSLQVMNLEKLHRLSRQNELLLRSIGEGIFGVDRSGTATFINPAASEMLLRPPGEFIGRCIDELLHPAVMDDEAMFIDSSISASLLDGTIRTVDNEFFERSDGTRFPVEYTSTPIIEDGMIVGMVVAFRNISSRRANEERIWFMNTELENRVAERTAQLEEANRQKDLVLEREMAARAEAERANRVKDEFMAIVSHELRTPLTTIKTFTDLMLRNRIRDDERIEYLSLISSECDRQISLVQNVLDISSIESRGISISIESIDLLDLVRSSLIPHVRAAVAAGQTLNIDLPASLARVRGDAFAIRRIVSNLLENAVKYTPPGGTISVDVSESDKLTALHVRDTGRGIRREELSRIFDKFYRAGEDTTRGDFDTERGVGLGLYLARSLARQIGARIEVESRPGEGSTFTIVLEKWGASKHAQHNGTAT